MNKSIISALVFIICSWSSISLAGEFDTDLFGLSYHYNKAGADHNAHNRLDNAGLWVVNPGIGFGYDFRKDIHTGGFSIISQLGLFQNCANYSFFYDGAGVRYRKFIFKKFFFETNAMAMVTMGNDFDRKAYRLDLMPFVDFGLGYDFGKEIVTVSFSYVPQDSGDAVTNDTDITFLNISFGF